MRKNMKNHIKKTWLQLYDEITHRKAPYIEHYVQPVTQDRVFYPLKEHQHLDRILMRQEYSPQQDSLSKFVVSTLEEKQPSKKTPKLIKKDFKKKTA